MDWKKKVKEFFTLTRKSDGGFTLVELIVVIAILAILSGVGVGVYNGYIAKVNREADEQLLAVVNKAYASACLVNGQDALVTRGYAKLNGEAGSRKVEKVTSFYDDDGADFAEYFKDNEDATFKVFVSLVWKEDVGKFVGEEMSSLNFNGKDYSFLQSDIDAYKYSNFFDIGVTETLELMDTLVDTVIGATYIDPDTGEIKGALASLKGDPAFTKYLQDNGLDPSINDQVATGLAFYTAEKMASIDPNAIAAAMTGNASADIDNMYKVISGSDNPTYSEKAVSAAIMYAMTAGYAKSDFAPAGTQLPTGEDEIASSVQLAGYLGDYYQQEGFKQYLASATAAEDLAGLIGVLRTLDTNDENALGIFEETGDYSFNQLDYEDLINEFLKQGQ